MASLFLVSKSRDNRHKIVIIIINSISFFQDVIFWFITITVVFVFFNCEKNTYLKIYA